MMMMRIYLYIPSTVQFRIFHFPVLLNVMVVWLAFMLHISNPVLRRAILSRSEQILSTGYDGFLPHPYKFIIMFLSPTLNTRRLEDEILVPHTEEETY